MSYHIYAWLDDGKPQLHVVDAESEKTCMQWSYAGNGAPSDKDKYEIQRLFRDLLLLTCKQEVVNCRVYETAKIDEQPS